MGKTKLELIYFKRLHNENVEKEDLVSEYFDTVYELGEFLWSNKINGNDIFMINDSIEDQENKNSK